MARKKSGWVNPWSAIGWSMIGETAMLAAEAQGVIALRLARLAQGGRHADVEAARMIVEKVTAFIAANAAAAAVLPIGGMAAAAGTVVATYRRSVRANHRRLSRRRR